MHGNCDAEKYHDMDANCFKSNVWYEHKLEWPFHAVKWASVLLSFFQSSPGQAVRSGFNTNVVFFCSIPVHSYLALVGAIENL